MRILVYDVAAEDGGGLFVLKNFYNEVSESLEKYPEIEWTFITSYSILQSRNRVQVINYEWIKKSWIHRLYFEEFIIQKLIKDLRIDIIISLQNTTIKRTKLEQHVYLHQSLQFCPKRFSLFNQEECRLAIRQKFICGMYKNGLKKAKHIYVQTKWIKESTEKWISCKKEKVTVVPVNVENLMEKKVDESYMSSKIFFYPARAELYKNHEIIVDACRILKKRGIRDYKVIFTINKDDNSYAQHIAEMSNELPIEFIGKLPYENIWEFYQNTILLFPSYLETCGLPLLEAKQVGSYILASNMPFSHEALEDYENVSYFDYLNAKELAKKMKEIVENKKKCVIKGNQNHRESSLLTSMLSEILKE